MPKPKPAVTKGIVVIAGGGTGGHIYPGVAVARAVEAMHPELKVHFVGAEGGLEEKIVPREGFPLHTVPIGKASSQRRALDSYKNCFDDAVCIFLGPENSLDAKASCGFGSGRICVGPNAFRGLAFWLPQFDLGAECLPRTCESIARSQS